MREYRNCAVCGKMYVAIRANQRYCGSECRYIGLQRLEAEKRASKRKKKKKKASIVDVAVDAKKAGMSYGEYVAKMGV